MLATWNAVVVPYGMAWLALFEGTESTLSGIDRKVFRWIYLYACLNVLLGGMLAGTLFSQLENIIRSPSSVFVLLGHAVPQSSGFFLAYLSTNALILEPLLRAFVPHAGAVLFPVLKIFARTERDRADAWTRGARARARTTGANSSFCSSAFCSATPRRSSPRWGWCIFALSFVIWRYQLLYVFVRSYESGASFSRRSPRASSARCASTRYSCPRTSSSRWRTCLRLSCGSRFRLFCGSFTRVAFARSRRSRCTLPLALAKETPVADIPEDTFGAPQMHQTFKGWGAEVGKVWQGYGAFVKKFV